MAEKVTKDSRVITVSSSKGKAFVNLTHVEEKGIIKGRFTADPTKLDHLRKAFEEAIAELER